MCNRTCIIVYRIRLYVYETCQYHEPITWNDYDIIMQEMYVITKIVMLRSGT